MKNKQIIKAGIGYSIGNYLLKGIAFFTTPIFARLMTTADFGKYNVFVSYESILFVIIGLAIHSSYKNAYYKFKDPDNADDETGYKKYISTTMVFMLASAFCWTLAAWLFNEQLTQLLRIDSVMVYLLVAVSFSSAVANCFSADKGIHYQYQQILLISLISTIISVGMSIFLMQTTFKNRMYLGRIIGGFLPGFIIYFVIALNYIRQAGISGMRSALKWGILYSLPIVPHGISQIILGQFDRIMIQRMIGESQAGLYSFAYTIYSMIAVASTSIDGIWSPWFYAQRKAENYSAIKKISGLYIAFMTMVCIAITLLSPEVIYILGGEKYAESVYCTIPIIGGGFFACIYNIPCLVEYYHEKTKLIALSTSMAAVLNIILNAIFIRLYGYIAAAYTTLVTYGIYFILHYYVARKIEKKDLFSWKLIMIGFALLLLSAITTLLTIDRPLVRIIILICFTLIGLWTEEKKYKYISKVVIPTLYKKLKGKA